MLDFNVRYQFFYYIQGKQARLIYTDTDWYV